MTIFHIKTVLNEWIIYIHKNILVFIQIKVNVEISYNDFIKLRDKKFNLK